MWSRKTDPRLEDRLKNLEDLVLQQERRLKEIEVEWEGWFDKYRRLYARISKRVQRQRDEEPPADSEAPAAAPRALGNPIAAAILRGHDGVLHGR